MSLQHSALLLKQKDGRSVADPHHFDADPDPAFHFDADPGFIFHCDADLDLDPTIHFDADPDPSFQIKSQILENVLK